MIMTRARNNLIDLTSTPYYHVISRCVRRAFLCGRDKYTGKSFEHRRSWLVHRVKLLSSVFAIEIAAYAIMSNHYHLVLKVNKEQALNWTLDEVIDCWYRLYKTHPLVDSYRQGLEMSEAQVQVVHRLVNTWRQRLYDISWFMKNLNEYIARKANREDKCTGKFWEGRFKSQALLDETALLCCMAYVDLNPIRANISNSLKTSDFTSIQERIRQFHESQRNTSKQKKQSISIPKQPAMLLSLSVNTEASFLPFCLTDYLSLVNWSCKSIRAKKQRLTCCTESILLTKLSIEEDFWLDAINHFEQQYGNFAGCKQHLRHCANENNHLWYKGVG